MKQVRRILPALAVLAFLCVFCTPTPFSRVSGWCWWTI